MVNRHLPGPFRIRHVRVLEKKEEEIFPDERAIRLSTGMGKEALAYDNQEGRLGDS